MRGAAERNDAESSGHTGEGWFDKKEGFYMVHNKVILIGRLARDAVIVPPKEEGQKPIAHFSIAVGKWRKKDGGEENAADFFRCNAYGQRAEFLERYGKKGVKFAVEGRLASGGYEKDGVWIPTVEVDVENMEFCERKVDVSEMGERFMEIPEGDELPFK